MALAAGPDHLVDSSSGASSEAAGGPERRTIVYDMSLTRRSFLNVPSPPAAATSSWSFAQGGAGGSSILDHTGSRSTPWDLMKDPAATFKAIADLGYEYVEGGLFLVSRLAIRPPACRRCLRAHLPRPGNRQAWATPGAGELVA
jgi:hypothetical protein